MLETYQARTKGIVFPFENLADDGILLLRETLNEDVFIIGLTGTRYTSRNAAIAATPLLVRPYFPDEQSMFNAPLPWEAVIGSAENMMPFKAPPLWKARQELFIELRNGQGYEEEWGQVIVWVVAKDAVAPEDQPGLTPWQTRTQIHGTVIDEFGPGQNLQRGITFNRSGYIWAVQGCKWSVQGGASDLLQVWYGFQQNASVLSDYAGFTSVVGSGLFPRWFKAPLPVTEHQTIQVTVRNGNAQYDQGCCIAFHFVPTTALRGMVP